MIGHFLATLTPEQEDRILTGTMKGYSLPPTVGEMLDPAHFCLVQRADGQRLRAKVVRWPRFLVWGCDSAMMRYDDLYAKYGDRINVMIRNRILRNRLWRTLKNTSGQLAQVAP